MRMKPFMAMVLATTTMSTFALAGCDDPCSKEHLIAVMERSAEFIPGTGPTLGSLSSANGLLDCRYGCITSGSETYTTGTTLVWRKSKQETLRDEAKAKESEAAKLDRQEKVAKELVEIIRACK